MKNGRNPARRVERGPGRARMDERKDTKSGSSQEGGLARDGSVGAKERPLRTHTVKRNKKQGYRTGRAYIQENAVKNNVNRVLKLDTAATVFLQRGESQNCKFRGKRSRCVKSKFPSKHETRNT